MFPTFYVTQFYIYFWACIQLFNQRRQAKQDQNFQEDIAVLDCCHAEMPFIAFPKVGNVTVLSIVKMGATKIIVTVLNQLVVRYQGFTLLTIYTG
jgi:hypothetical protein